MRKADGGSDWIAPEKAFFRQVSSAGFALLLCRGRRRSAQTAKPFPGFGVAQRRTLNSEARRRVVGEHLPDADVLCQSLRRLVPSLAHDVAFVRSIHGRLRDAASTE